MIIKQYIKDFEKLGFGMFVHFGLYSIVGKGEWSKCTLAIPDEYYFEELPKIFNPKKDWAKKLVAIAKQAGCKYITLTTRHHDGFSLFDTCGLNTFDAPHAKCGRDLVREFVDACREEDIIPFFYHTLLDWHEKTYYSDFQEYLKYLRASVEILCKNYGKIGGFWFDGMWDKANEDWEEDALYGTIRKYQPEAMIINNTGLGARGTLGHIELDSVTFERGKPQPLNMEGAPKYVASEMCEVFCNHWAYAKEDFDYKGPRTMIEELVECRKYGSNLLMNVGPMADGSVRPIDAAILGIMGEWVNIFDEAIRTPRPTNIEIPNKEKDFILRDGKNYYLFCSELPTYGNSHVAIFEEKDYLTTFELEDTISSVTWMDDGTEVEFSQNGKQVSVVTVPYTYGRHLVVRVAKIVCK